MRTYIADIIPKLQKFSQRLDDLTRLKNQHWVSLGDIDQTKRVFIFRPNNQLLISDNGIVEKGSWEYLGNQTLLMDTKQESYLLKHGFFDENVIALKLDSTDNYAFFVNETKYHKELNNISDILKFLENKYLKTNQTSSGLGSTNKGTINETFGYDIISEKESYDIAWGKHIIFELKFLNGKIAEVYKGNSTGKYFYMNFAYGKMYFKTFEEAAYNLHSHLKEKN
jgi:hypothetical protein